MSNMIPWEEMSERAQLLNLWSDAFKDAYGFRPRMVDTSQMTVESLKLELDRLGEVIRRQIEEDSVDL